MRRRHNLSAALAMAAIGLAFAGPVLADSVTDPDRPRSVEAGPVTVSWTDPAGFSEIRYSRNRFEAVRGDWVRDIARHIASRATRVLEPGDRLQVGITDIERAGEFEPGHGGSDRVRIVRDLYPPHIDLSWELRDASGTVVSSGERRLRDLGFLHRQAGTVTGGDPLRHEKRLVEAWVREDLARGQR